LTLAALPHDAVTELLADLIGLPVEPDLVALARVAAGNPGALQELVDDLRDGKLLDTTSARAGLTTRRLTTRLRLSIHHVLANLSPAAGQLVKVASMVAEPLRLDTLATLLHEPAARLISAVDEALASGLVVCAGEAIEFSHELAQVAVVE